MTKKTQVIVVGGGAGGLELVTRLGAKFGRRRHDIILVERNRTHIWKPLLHEVAAGSLDANLDEVGYRSHCYRWGYRFFMGALQDIDREAGEIVLAPIVEEDGAEITGVHRLRYDYLVLAVGSVSNDFNTPGAARNALFLDDQRMADKFRHKLLDHCLRVSRTLSSHPTAEAYVRVAIVGGGATGVELAAELFNAAAALKFYGLEVFDETRLQVTLIEAGPRILPALPEPLAEAAHNQLVALGVRVVTGMAVTEVLPDGMRLGSGEFVAADLRVWAAGVKAPEFLREIAGLETNRGDQIVVRPTLQTTQDDHIMAIGDCCAFTQESGRLVPPRAQAAHQMAETAFSNLVALMEDRPLRPFVYHDHGSLVSLSRFSTVGSLMGNLVGGRMAIEGRLARFAYISLYRMHLLAIHGWFSGLVFIVVSKVNNVVRPRLKLH